MCSKMKKVFCYGVMLIALSLAGVMTPKEAVNAALPKLQETEVTSYRAPDLTISNAREFSEFANNVTNGNDYEGKLVVLSADIKFDGVTTNNYTPAGYGGSFYGFRGIFDGMGHTISGINVTFKGTASLFTAIDSTAVVKNVTVSDSSFQGAYVSGIVGANYGIIENCSVKGCKLTPVEGYGKDYMGGIAAQSEGTVRNCYTYNTAITGNQNYYVGGIVGINSRGGIYNCVNQASVTSAGKYVGGIAGDTFKGTIENCYNVGKVTLTGTSGYAGGIAGYVNDSIVAHCYTSTSSNSKNFGYMGGTERDNKAYSESDMKAAAFLDLLNANRGAHNDWARWEKRSESAYPLPAKATDITTCVAALSAAGVTYNFKEQKPTVTVTDNGVSLVEGVDYTVTYPEDLTNPGEKIIFVDSAGTYYGRIELVYTIEKADQSFTGTTSYSKAYNSGLFKLDVKQKINGGKVTYVSSNEKVAKFNADGSVSPVGIGTAVLTISAAESDYFKPASININVKVTPVKVSLYSAYKKKGKINVYWGRDYKAGGYQVQYSTDKKFKKNTKAITVKKSKKTSCKIKKIKRKKKYYIRVRAYKKGIYGPWSKKVRV